MDKQFELLWQNFNECEDDLLTGDVVLDRILADLERLEERKNHENKSGNNSRP